jgi:hypothetical protein
MMVAVVGIDLAKRVFQLHGVDARGRPVVTGNDSVRGGPGTDLLQGNAGQDVFDFDLITDSAVGGHATGSSTSCAAPTRST